MQKKGFTLFELLIALSISSFVAVGLYTILTSIVTAKDITISQSENIIMVQAITQLVNKDTRMMLESTLAVDSLEPIKKLKFTTNNSLRFNKTLPVEISYYVKDNWLIRREINTQLLFDMEMKLLPGVTDMVLEFYDGNEFQEEVIKNAKIFKITLTINEAPFIILGARTVDNT